MCVLQVPAEGGCFPAVPLEAKGPRMLCLRAVILMGSEEAILEISQASEGWGVSPLTTKKAGEIQGPTPASGRPHPWFQLTPNLCSIF